MDQARHLFLGGLNAPDEEVEQRMIEEIDATLDRPPRLELAVNTIIGVSP